MMLVAGSVLGAMATAGCGGGGGGKSAAADATDATSSGGGGAGDVSPVGGNDTSTVTLDGVGGKDSSGTQPDAGGTPDVGAPDAHDGGDTATADAGDTGEMGDTGADVTADAGDAGDAADVAGADSDTQQADTADGGDTGGELDADTAQDGGGPLPCTTDADCADLAAQAKPCEVPACNPTTGTCLLAPAPDGTACDDGDPCTEADTCTSGTCAGNPKDCDDGEACTADACDPADGSCTHDALDDGNACDDGNPCTEGDACTAGACAGSPKDCDDGEACTADACDPADGSCTHDALDDGTACDDGNPCTQGETCASGTCQGGEDLCQTPCTHDNECADLDDGNKCNGVPKCVDHVCQIPPDTVVVCDASNDGPCQATQCDPATGQCAQAVVPDGTPCDDGDACTTGDQCVNGSCVGGTSECSNGCQPSTLPGCAGCECEQCVCDIDPYCCEQAWDDTCVALCTNDCGMQCEVSPPGGCVATPDQAGCDGCECEQCVCDIDSYCCAVTWDDACVSLCENDCGSPCSDFSCEGACGGLAPGGCSCAAGCEADGTCCPDYQALCGSCDGYCGDVAPGGCSCQDGCDVDGTCCADYDSACGGGGGTTGAGCEESDFGGCGGCPCEACVCDLDSFCCSFSWDSLCVDECINDCGGCEPCVPDCSGVECGNDGCGGSCGECSGADEVCIDGQCVVPCGNGSCEPDLDETCLSCPEDCGTCTKSSGCHMLDQPTCGGCSCEQCVCDTYPYCCETQWDADCVAACAFDCGGCDPEPGCTPSTDGTAGCDGCECEACVCAEMPQCCDTLWDEACVLACQNDCGTDCGLCTSDVDCFDGDACTIDTCDTATGECHHEGAAMEGCCTTDADCDDGDACTVDTCVDFHCQIAAAADPACCPDDGIIFSADFEQVIPFQVKNTSQQGGWQVSTARSHSPTHSMWYGSALTGNLDFPGSEGWLTSEPFFLPPAFTLTLHVWRWTADSYDNIEVHLLVDGDDVTLYDDYSAKVEGDWEEIKADLKPWAGKKVQIQIYFDHFNSSAEGVYVDDIVVDSDCVIPVCGDGVCNGDEHCLSCPQDCPAPDTCPDVDGCTAWDYPTCAGCDCEQCVCDIDPDCCDVQWDSKCADLCGTQCGTQCGPPPGCVPSSGPGCNGCACETCVCGIDSFCCSTTWDSICAGECAEDCGFPCP